ncbi:hypothetical protein ACHWQZ_G009481 [Mnemiopsis leidyi]
MKKEVRILLLGDADVGKTSLILSLVSEEFPQHVPLRAEEITIPADVTPEGVPTHIVDYSAREYFGEEFLVKEMQRAHVFCLVYGVDDEKSLESTRSYWLPKIREINDGDNLSRPVILVGNKDDLIMDLEESPLESVLPLMNEYPEIETCVECSAKRLKNISELFYYAQKAVLHPTAPLYSPDMGKLKPACAEALRRVFRICDMDNDGFLSDHELNEFQKRCFNAPLQQSNLMEVKNLIKKYCDHGIVDNKMSEMGFLFLHTIFIQKGRHETTWTVLRKFGYTDQLEVSDEYLRPDLHVEPGSSVELTEEGSDYLISLFQKHDLDKDNILSPSELANLFSVCPNIPWGDFSASVMTSEMGWLTQEGYEALWTLNMLLYPEHTMEYLGYLGYNSDTRGNQLTAVQVTPPRHDDFKRQVSSRNVLLSYVFGPKGCGKSCFINRLIKKGEIEISPETDRHICINKIRYQAQQEKYFILQEVCASDQEEILERGGDCDLAIVLYDTSRQDSFSKAVEIQERLDVPSVFIGMKSDKSSVKQDYDYTPEQYSQMAGLPPPLFFSAMPDRESAQLKIFQTCVLFASHPFQQQSQSMPLSKIITTSAAVAVAGMAAFFLFKYVRRGR